MKKFFSENCENKKGLFILKREYEHITICEVENVSDFVNEICGLVRFVKGKLIDYVYKFEGIEIENIDIEADEENGDFDQELLAIDAEFSDEDENYKKRELELIKEYKKLFFCHSRLESLISNAVNCGSTRRKPFDIQLREYVEKLQLDCGEERFVKLVPEQITIEENPKYAISFDYFFDYKTDKTISDEEEVQKKVEYLAKLKPDFVEGYKYYFTGSIIEKGFFKIEDNYRVDKPVTFHTNYWHIDSIIDIVELCKEFNLKEMVNY